MILVKVEYMHPTGVVANVLHANDRSHTSDILSDSSDSAGLAE